MRITDVEAIPLRLPEITDAADSTQDALIVKVHTMKVSPASAKSMRALR